jgi:hypothetical protein
VLPDRHGHGHHDRHDAHGDQERHHGVASLARFAAGWRLTG